VEGFAGYSSSLDFTCERRRIISIDLLGELDRLRDPERKIRDDPSNLLDNTSGGKQIPKRF
jgi:hypothetical protein